MSTYYRAENKGGEIIMNTFPINLYYLFSSKLGRPKPIDISINGIEHKARYGEKSNKYGTLKILTTEKKYVNSLKTFKNLINANLILLENISFIKETIHDTFNQQTQQLIHNLTSLNTYNIQDLFSLVPQHLLSQQITKQEELVKEIHKNQPNVSARTILKLIKNNLAMKVEFSVFEKTMENYPSVTKSEHSIKKLVLSILQIFVNDFEEKNITLSLDSSEKILNIDSEILNVSIFYILDNAVKYCAKNSKFKIVFKEELDCFSIIFDMVSLQIKPEEVKLLCELNYRAENAKRFVQKGEGIGMYRIQKTLQMNDAILEIFPRYSNYQRNISGENFEHNIFKIRFKNQQSWL